MVGPLIGAPQQPPAVAGPLAVDPAPVGDPSTADAAAVAAALGTDLQQGLAAAEAASRLTRDGPNELRPVPQRTAWRRALSQLQDPLVGLLLVAAAVALLAWWVEGRHGWPIDAVVIAVVVLLNALIGWLQESKAANAVAELARLTAANSSTLRDGRLQQVLSSQLVRGDVLVLAEGDAVGADARLFQASALQLLEASLTGESEAVLKDAATLAKPTALGDRLNMVYKGTAVAQGSGRAVVTATGMQSEVGVIATMLDATADMPTPLQREVARLGRGLAVAAVVIAVVVVGTILLTTQVTALPEIVRVLLLGVSLAVAVVPEGLPAILSVVLALGVQRMARRKAIVKKLASVETLGSASVIATDKTGTLTRAEMTVVRVITASGAGDITGVGYAPDGSIEQAGAALQDGPLREEITAVLVGGSLAGNAQLHEASPGTWQIQGDPTEAAFLVAERKLGGAEQRQRRYLRQIEIPFTSVRKMMSTIEADQDQQGALTIFTKGAPGAVLARCTRALVGQSTVVLDEAQRQRLLADVDGLADAALRTLAVAYRSLDANEDRNGGTALEHDLVYAGTVGIIDPSRAEAAVAIAQAHQAGIRVIMITGDHPRTALRIATDLGLVPAGGAVLTGLQLDALDNEGFAAAVQRTSVFARVAPKDKLRIVRALQAGGEVVAMTGDGVNDAPALKAADIGIAMGQTGTEVTKEAARMILADDNFATIVEAVREGRGVLDNIRKFLRYLLSSNLGEVLTVFGGVVGASVIGLDGAGAVAGSAAGAVVLPLLATQILWINLITDAGPALAMGMDPIADDVMARPPRRPSEPMIDRHMWAGVLATGLVMGAVTLLTMDMFLPGGLIAGSQTLDLARTAGFTVLVLAQLFNCFNARSESASAWHGLFANRWLWGAVALSAGLQVAVVHVPLLNVAFGTVPLDAIQWLACIGMASLVLWLGEVRKMVHRAWTRHGRSGVTAPSSAST